MTMLGPPTSDYLEFHAAGSPDAIALIHNRREYSYGQLYRDFLKFTKAIGNFDLLAGKVVAVCCSDVYVHLLILLALENNGIVTASFLPNEGPSCLPFLLKADLVIADDDKFASSVPRFHHLTAAWLNEVFLSQVEEADQKATFPQTVNDPIRLTRSSGTVGGQKMILKTRGMMDSHIMSMPLRGGLTHRSRGLFTLPITVNGAYMRYHNNLRMGLTSIVDSTMTTFDAMVKYHANYLMFIPVLLEKLLADMPTSFPKPEGVVVVLFGAAVSGTLRQRTLTRLATDIIDTYASNEAGPIALMDGPGTGTICPGVQVEIIDEDDDCLPLGEVGRIRVKTPWLIDGYVDNPEATAAMFRDGWFYTGDLGVLVEPRRLKLVGRFDELLNIGGLKMAPESIEEILLRAVPQEHSIKDLAVTSIENADGIEEICVAVVAGGHVEDQLIGDQIRKCLPLQYGRVRTKIVDHIPRTVSGKVQRYLLKTEFAG